jgi:hypothetical protein
LPGAWVLLDAVASRSAADDLSFFFAPEVAKSITQSEMQPAAGLGRQLVSSILFVDLRDFTSTAAKRVPCGPLLRTQRKDAPTDPLTDTARKSWLCSEKFFRKKTHRA